MVQFETSVSPVAFGRDSGGLIRRKFVSGIIRWSGIRGLKTMKSGSGWSVGGWVERPDQGRASLTRAAAAFAIFDYFTGTG